MPLSPLPSPLPPGATGFFEPGDGLPPKSDGRAFRTALYAAARASGGQVGEMTEAVGPRTFHTASVIHPEEAAESIVLCHLHHPWIAFAGERLDHYEDDFLVPPPWAGAFGAAGFLVLGRERLSTPLSHVDASAMSGFEWSQARCHGTGTLGGVLFNSWD
ncbi:hypothetical protein [Streptomyces adelaidensis]|jgi:hypothetical protein|uniref:hypothetical protein n=1 Tax=Streptomyces adelaidensis TaxID=2796465 RepID=UPI0019075193|nr:hypothetical protein [Streptomyces adelaidensis]